MKVWQNRWKMTGLFLLCCLFALPYATEASEIEQMQDTPVTSMESAQENLQDSSQVDVENLQEASEEDTETSIKLAIDGNTVYVDVQGTWSTVQGSIVFDPSYKVKAHGISEGLKSAVSAQSKIGIPLENLLEDEYVFVGVYTSITGEGVEYTGHAFYLTFEDVSNPLSVSLKDKDGTIIETAVLDGTTLPPEDTPSLGDEKNPDEQEGLLRYKWVQRLFFGIVLIAVAGIVALIMLVVKKSKKKHENSCEKENAK